MFVAALPPSGFKCCRLHLAEPQAPSGGGGTDKPAAAAAVAQLRQHCEELQHALDGLQAGGGGRGSSGAGGEEAEGGGGGRGGGAAVKRDIGLLVDAVRVGGWVDGASRVPPLGLDVCVESGEPPQLLFMSASAAPLSPSSPCQHLLQLLEEKVERLGDCCGGAAVAAHEAAQQAALALSAANKVRARAARPFSKVVDSVAAPLNSLTVAACLPACLGSLGGAGWRRGRGGG